MDGSESGLLVVNCRVSGGPEVACTASVSYVQGCAFVGGNIHRWFGYGGTYRASWFIIHC